MYIYIFTVFQATQLQTRYMELLTLSAEYYKFLGELMKNMEELKVLWSNCVFAFTFPIAIIKNTYSVKYSMILNYKRSNGKSPPTLAGKFKFNLISLKLLEKKFHGYSRGHSYIKQNLGFNLKPNVRHW